MNTNTFKYYLLVNSKNNMKVAIEETTFINSTEEKLLGKKLDATLSFESYISTLCISASKKLYALATIANYMDLQKRRSLLKAFITSQCNYWLLIWIFYASVLNN